VREEVGGQLQYEQNKVVRLGGGDELGHGSALYGLICTL
jgi:hypothetical protein